MVVRSLVVLAVAVSLSIVLNLGDDRAFAISSCVETEVVTVRGSGQIYGQSPELNAVKSLLPSTNKFIELENKIDLLKAEPEYAAIAVKGDLHDNAAGLGALVVSRLNMGRYKASVDSGKNLLKKYIEYLQPTDTCLVLVGYSQGAQVINETMWDMHEADPNSLKNVIYIGLIGDPLYSPYGFDDDRKPTWVRGNALYPFWGVLFKDVTIPGASKPDYVPRNPNDPTKPFTKIGSWCNYGDVICATNITHYAVMRDGHGTYTKENAQELVDEIKTAVANPDQNITGAIYPNSVCGAAKQDLVVLLDTSAYMRRNKDLFTKDRNTWDRKLMPGTNQRMFRTFGEQLLDSGCGDKRIAIAGFEGPTGQAPRLLLDFTSQAEDIDNLMDLLYAPSDGGVAERPQLREAAILAMEQDWRPDASRTLFAVTAMAGDGPVLKAGRQKWSSPSVMSYHLADETGQRLLALSRETRAAIIAAPYMPIDMSGFTVAPGSPSDLDAYSYFQSLARLTGGYNWEKTFITYPSEYRVKNIDFASEIQQFEKRRDATRVTMKSVRAKVGQPVTLGLNDHANLIAGAAQRAGHGTAIDWYLDCDSLQIQTTFPVVQKTGSTITFTPTKTGSCTAAARIFTQGSGNGCYWGCPEPFPPYMLRVIPFRLEVLPADYDEKIPGDITTMTKTIYDDRVEFSWTPSTYSGSEKPVYLVKDPEGSVLAATTTTQATVTGTEKQDVDILVQAIGADGRSQDFSSLSEAVQTIDIRTTPDVDRLEPPSHDVVPDTNINVGTNTNAHATPSPSVPSPVVASVPTDELQSNTPDPAEGQALGESVVKSVMAPAQIDSDLSRPENTSTKWWWGVPLFLLALWGIYRAESATRKR